MVPQMNRKPINNTTGDEHYETLKVSQEKYLNGSDSHKEVLTEEHSTNHNGQSYIIWVMKTGRLIMHI